MKYIISESRLKDFMINYLETLVERMELTKQRDFIVISNPIDENNWIDLMEYDYTDGRLWINSSLLKNFCDIFALDTEKAKDFFIKWFENKFEVKINFTES
jgi:hypothetical protein